MGDRHTRDMERNLDWAVNGWKTAVGRVDEREITSLWILAHNKKNMSSATCTRNDTIWKFVGVPSGAPPSPPLVYGYFRPLGQKQPEITSSPKSHQIQLGVRHRHWASPITNRFLGATWPNAKRSLHAFLDFPTEVPTRSGPKAAIECSEQVRDDFFFFFFFFL